MDNPKATVAEENVLPEIELLKLGVETWKKTIEVQQHFNDLGLRIRNFATLSLVATISAIGVTGKAEFKPVIISGIEVPLVVIAIVGGIIAWVGFWILDLWYHTLLIKAVKHGMAIENTLAISIPTIKLTNTISETPKVISYVAICAFYGVTLACLIIIAWLIEVPK